MDFLKELNEMRASYAKRPLRNETLPMPRWMKPSDGLYCIYTEKEELFRCGQVYYGYLVQANNALFNFWPQLDLPASIIYSAEDAVSGNPLMLKRMGAYLYHFKNDAEEYPDSEFKNIINVIRDEYDRSSFKFRPLCGEELGDMYFTSIMVFRKHLPRRVLNGGIIPVIAAPDKCGAVMILPKRYWTKTFRKAWLEHFSGI